LARNYGLTDKDVRRVERLIEQHEQEIRDVWSHHFGAEVTDISKQSFWLLLDGRDLLPFEEVPRFKRAPVEAILRLERPRPGHLCWPDLDVDLSVDSIEHPERYPLKAKH
jgi:Protein of unknown function (DUF2442)